MARSMVEVTAVPRDELRDFVGLWLASKIDAGVPLEVATRFANDGRLELALGRPDVYAHVARIDGRPVGYVVTTENPFGLQPEPEIAIELLFVDPGVPPPRCGPGPAVGGRVVGRTRRVRGRRQQRPDAEP